MNKPFNPTGSIETEFARQLRKIARHAGHIVGVHIDGEKIIDEPGMQKALREYSKLITPWARKKSLTMITKVSKANARAMRTNAKAIGQGMRLVAESKVGVAAASLMDEQVELIRSIPLKAGERAQKLAMTAVYEGTRAAEIAQRLRKTTEVSEADAMLIARTETARANSILTESRATAIGSTHYRWRNSGDAAVRDAHKYLNGKKLDGMVFEWGKPPTLDDGTTGQPGTFPNCRCYPEPIFND